MKRKSTPDSLSLTEKRERLALLTEKARRARRRKLFTYYPDTGPLRRELYPRHMAFFAAGREYKERLMLAANRVGKTEGVGGYETTLHLTGLYPNWWPGYRFDRPIRAWAAGDTGETVRDILQAKLLGPPEDRGTGLIPGDTIIRMRSKGGVADYIDTVSVNHYPSREAFEDGKPDGISRLGFKSYDQGRKSFQGTEQDVVFMDEEPPLDVYNEAMIRTAGTVLGRRGGLMLCTFTPLLGVSSTVLYFLPGGILPGTDAAIVETGNHRGE